MSWCWSRTKTTVFLERDRERHDREVNVGGTRPRNTDSLYSAVNRGRVGRSEAPVSGASPDWVRDDSVDVLNGGLSHPY